MIFVSCRDESAHSAGRLAHLLGERLGTDEVFLADTLGGGADLAAAVATALRRSTAGIVVVDPTWTAAAEPVIRQVRTLLDRGVAVLPVLVDGAAPPRADDLPESVRALAKLRAVRLDHLTFRSDAEQVFEWLAAAGGDGPTVPRRRPRERRPAAPDRPVTWWRSLWRIALWWAVFPFATVTAANAFDLLFGGDRRFLGAAVAAFVIQLLLLGSCIHVLRREIGTQRLRIDRVGPDAEASSAGRAVSGGRVRLLTGACVTVALLLGWSMGGPP